MSQWPKPGELVTQEGVRLVSRPEPHAFYPSLMAFEIEGDGGEKQIIRIHKDHKDRAAEQFAAIKGDMVDVTHSTYVWQSGDKSGTVRYFHEVKESTG